MPEGALDPIDEALRGAGRRIADRSPRCQRLLLRARDGYARAHVRLRRAVNRRRYAVPPDPYRFIEVDPARVRRVDPVDGPKFRHAGTVRRGDWDRTTRRFEEMDVYRAYERHFRDGVPWDETPFYARVVSEIEGGATRWGCRTRAAFDERCEQLDGLYEAIRTDGYRTQAELRSSGATDPIQGDHPVRGRERLKTERLKHEIAVNIGRDGEVLFSDGRNRLSIAKLLDLDAVPARVLRRHAGWQAVRDAYVRGEPVPDEHLDHPDLAGLDRGSR